MSLLPQLSAQASARDITCCNPAKGDTLSLQRGQLVWTDNSCCSCSCFGSGESDANRKVWALFESALTSKHGEEAVRNALRKHKFHDSKAKKKSITPEMFNTIVTHIETDSASKSVASFSMKVPSTPSNSRVILSAAPVSTSPRAEALLSPIKEDVSP